VSDGAELPPGGSLRLPGPSASGLPKLAIELVGQSPAVVRARELVRRAAPLAGGVLLVAEPGTDTDSVAREIHERSRFADQPWRAVACAESDGPDLERLLFGTAPPNDEDLVVVTADSVIAAVRGGTLFLRDAVELSAGLQARLARWIRDGEVRIGRVVVPATVRLIASVATTIEEDVRSNRFRHDLYRRLAVSRVDLPPLRERSADIPALADRLLEDACAEAGVSGRRFTEAAHALLAALSWPDNLAELRHAVLQAFAATDSSPIQIEDLLPALQIERAAAPFVPSGTLRDARLRFERAYISAVLQHHGWQLGEAARTLGIQRPNLYRKARQLGIPISKQTA
jgi:DNA-binding NtrC family response regulator